MNLYKAIEKLKTHQQARAFLTDLCTPKEIESLIERWEVAKLLSTKKYTYREIATKLGASTTTVTRVARFLFNENNNGYKSILNNNGK
ncbi:MAG: YerC/YecD family TrpR-related protein [Gammaproteobacteria bacterium]|tara:strand:- start:419 stop:682 length:264 start_codon:yes stop_codon:yes gene_type:complete